MSLTNLFAKIAGRHQERQQARKADFKSLVQSVANGHEPDPDEVERVLAETGKTLEDLRHAVELFLKRRARKKAVDQQSKLEREREQLEKQLIQANNTLTAAEQKHKETTDPLLGQRDCIRDQMLEIDRAKSELARTCDDQDLLNELAKTERQLNVLHKRTIRASRHECPIEQKVRQAAANVPAVLGELDGWRIPAVNEHKRRSRSCDACVAEVVQALPAETLGYAHRFRSLL